MWRRREGRRERTARGSIDHLVADADVDIVFRYPRCLLMLSELEMTRSDGRERGDQRDRRRRSCFAQRGGPPAEALSPAASSAAAVVDRQWIIGRRVRQGRGLLLLLVGVNTEETLFGVSSKEERGEASRLPQSQKNKRKEKEKKRNFFFNNRAKAVEAPRVRFRARKPD